MSDQRKGGIAWCDQTWNPIRGCSRVSEGCRNCYAESVAARFSGPGQPYEGLAERRHGKARWTGEVQLVLKHLADPLRWRRPRKIFVNSMSDLFHEKLSDETIAAVFGVMAAAPQHTFQVLTKRPERMRRWFEWVEGHATAMHAIDTGHNVETGHMAIAAARKVIGQHAALLNASMRLLSERDRGIRTWPLPNVWLGVSVENQKAAEDRIDLLLDCPAAVRFLSVEPQLEEVDIARWLREGVPQIDWVIVGGESGPGARRFDVGWARKIQRQCADARVAFFMKQLGAQPVETGLHGGFRELSTTDRAGGDPSEWPEDIRVQEFPR